MAIKRKWMPSPCYHSRGGTKVRLIILHTAEGATTIESLGNFFANGGNEVSSHTGADDKPNILGEYVTRGNAAWTQAYFNEEAVALELCGFAKWSRDTWLNQHRNMLDNAAAWVREEAAHYGIPITALNDNQAQGNGRGVCEHINLGSGGGGHVDCGNGFPMDYVINAAKGQAPAASPNVIPEDAVMQLFFDEGNPDADEMPACALAIPNEYSGGKHKLRFTCRRPVTLRVIFASGRTDITLDYLTALSVMIPDGERSAIIKAEPGVGPVSPVSVAFSER